MTGWLAANWQGLAGLALCALFSTLAPAASAYMAACLLVGWFLFRETADRRPRRSRLAGLALRLAGLAGLWVIALTLSSLPLKAGAAFSIFVACCAWGFWSWGGQLSMPDAAEVLVRDPRPPVLFLRPFQEEQRLIESKPIGEREGGEFTATATSSASREPELAGAFRGLGPFVAVGRPGEPLATEGAARVYLADNEWKPFVERTVRSAAAVVLQPELTPGTLWEVGLAVRTVDLRRLLLIVPDPARRPFRYERVRGLVAETFGVELPAGAGGSWDAFYFDAERRPVPVRLDAPQALAAFVEHARALGPPGGAS